MDRKQISDYLEAHREDLVEDLCRFIRIPSVSDDKEQVQRALDYILEIGDSMGFRTASLLEGQVGVIEVGEGDEVLGILAHVDVVSPGDRSAWRTDPFEPTIADGAVYGRGALDDKGAIIASLYAMKAAAESGKPFHKKVQMILGTQEEVDWTDMRAYVKQFPLPDYGFTPDGEFPLCNIEKGGLDVNLIFPFGQLLGAEDGLYLTGLDAGTANNIVPGSCIAVLSRKIGDAVTTETIHTSGKAVHSCQPEKGENAIFAMAEELKKRNLQENQLSTLLLLTQEKFMDLYGRGLGLYSKSEYYNGEFVHRNVFAPTFIKIIDGKVQLHINVRFGYGTDPQEILQGLQLLAASCGGWMDHVSLLPAVYVSRERPFLQSFADAYEEMTNRKNEFVLAYGGSYAKAMPNIVSWGPIFPDDEDTCHEANEYISIKSLMENAAIFAAAIGKIAFSKDSFR